MKVNSCLLAVTRSPEVTAVERTLLKWLPCSVIHRLVFLLVVCQVTNTSVKKVSSQKNEY